MELHLALNSRNLKMASLALALSTILLTTAGAKEVKHEITHKEGDTDHIYGLVRYPGASIRPKEYKSLYSKENSSNNVIVVEDYETRTLDVMGGYIDHVVPPAWEGVNDNFVDIKGDVSAGYIIGGYLANEVSRLTNKSNRVEIDGNNLGASIIGGWSSGKEQVTEGNSVMVRGYLERGSVIGGQGFSVTDNKVEIKQGVISGKVFGGLAEKGIYANSEIGLNASGNTVEITGKITGGDIYGGYISAAPHFGGGPRPAISGKAESNKVIINSAIGEKTVGNARLYGGFFSKSVGDNEIDIFSGNTLEFSGGPLKVHEIANFENYHFWINPSLKGASEAHLSADNVYLGAEDGLSSKFKVVGVLQGETLNVNDSFLLLEAKKMMGNGEGSTSEVGQLQQGISVIYDVKTTIDQDSGKVLATILGEDKEEEIPGIDQGGKDEEGFTPTKPAGRINPQLKALSEGNLANLMLVTRGADLVAYSTFDAIKAQNEGGFNTFIQMEGGHNRYSSGSHIKSNDFHLMTGLSLRQDSLTAAAFVEAGWGDYDTRNSFVDVANVDGDGKSRYVGVGVLGRYDFTNGMYVDGSFRIGSSHNKFNTSDIKNFTTGEEVRYSFSRTYVSAHAGLGYIYDIDSTNAIDFSAKYLWTHLGSKNLTVAGDNLKFKSLDSNRVQLRATWNHQANDSIKLKAGVGYEYEFSAKAKATARDMYSVNAPSVKGSTGIATLGINVNPESNKRLDVDFNINGYTGKREGVSANIKVGYNF